LRKFTSQKKTLGEVVSPRRANKPTKDKMVASM
jgi:hypothetical protein